MPPTARPPAAAVLRAWAAAAARAGNGEAAAAWLLCADLAQATAAHVPATLAASTGRRVIAGAQRGGRSRSASYASAREAAQRRYLELKASNPRRSDSDLARQIARELGANATTVRTSWLKPVRAVQGTSQVQAATVGATDPPPEQQSCHHMPTAPTATSA